MSAKTRERRLAAVWFADIVGFTRLSSRDEDAALRLVEVFQAVTRKVVTSSGGTVVKFLGDGGLAVFPSADAAVRAGLDVQRAFEEKVSTAGMAAKLRIGIHLGEVVSETDGDVYGDGVNTASRIQHEAEPGQVVVSEDVWRQIRRRSGYQFDALGERELPGLDEPVRIYAIVAAPEAIELDPESVPPPRMAAGWRKVAIGGASALVLAAIAWVLFARSDIAGPTTAEAASSIAVLPFTDLSPGGGQEYFGDGITEELINALTKLEGIGVVSRTSAFAYKGQNLDVREIGRRLEVGNVLEGSIRVAGDRLRVTARLVDVEDGIDLWSESYDRDMKDVFAIQEEIARSIVRELEPELASSGIVLVPTGTRNAHAYRLYLQGRYFWNKRTREGLARATELFEAAIRSDTTYALAYSGMADVYNTLRQRGHMSVAETIEKQRAAIRKAIELEPELSEAHTSYAQLLFDHDREWGAAGREFEHAVDLDPRNANARHWYSHYLTAMGRTQESLAQSQRAIEISPYDVILQSHLAWHYLFARDYDRAVEEATRAVEMDPADAFTRGALAWAYQATGRRTEGLAEAEKAAAQRRDDAFTMGMVGFAYARLDRRREAIALAQDLESRGDQTYYAIAVIHAGLGDRDRAIAWLERGYAHHSPGLPYVRVDPRLDDLRSDPRLDSLLQRMHL
jgi:adenylate cyclase